MVEAKLQEGCTGNPIRRVLMFQHMLVPLDGSPRAEQALPVAARIARATGGSVLLVQLISPPIDYSGGLAPVSLMNNQVIESEMIRATAYLKELAASPLLTGINTRIEVSFGLPAQYLVAAVQAHRIDLVVLCSHGRTGFTRWALGSVAHSLVHQSSVPVLVLQQRGAAALLSHLETARPLSVLVPLDGSPLAETVLIPAANLIAALAAPAQGALRLVQVVKLFPESVEKGFMSELNEEALQYAKTYLKAVVERLQETVIDLKLALTYSVELGTDVASILVDLAERGGENGCDLVAISTHGRSGLERWVIGSVTDRVMSTTRLPMLIVRPPNKR
jgi:nucleotide-binding universal stress UspA family protein